MSQNVPSTPQPGQIVPPKPKKLTYKHTRFIHFYTGNATEAAINAGYSKKTAHSQGQRLLKNVAICNSIQERDRPKTQIQRDIMSAEEIREQWSTMARTAEKESDRLKALELLAKAKGMFIERSIQLSGNLTDLSDSQLGRKLRQAFHSLDIPPILLEQLAGRMPVIGNTITQGGSTIDTNEDNLTDIDDNPRADNVNAGL